MATSFPALAPSSRRVVQGQYATKRFTSIAGTGTTRVYGSQPFNASMELEFANVLDTDAQRIAAAYDAARGSYDALTLPSEVWQGLDSTLRTTLERDYSWRFGAAPTITSVSPGRSSLSVTLEGQRDG